MTEGIRTTCPIRVAIVTIVTIVTIVPADPADPAPNTVMAHGTPNLSWPPSLR
jgi:hypothetical protein